MRCALTLMALVLMSANALAQDVQVISSCHVRAQKEVAGADYKPGVDVAGKAVASADLNNQIKPVAHPIEIPIELDVVKFLDLDMPDAAKDAVDLKPNVAFLTVHEDGRIDYNGQDVSSKVSYACDDEAARSVYVPTEEIKGEVLEAAPTQKIDDDPQKKQEEHGQGALDSVLSGEKIEGQSP